MKKLKLLFLIESLSGGGAEKVLSVLLKHLDKTKFDITLCTIVDTGIYAEEVKKYVKYTSVLGNLQKKNLLGKIVYKILYLFNLELFPHLQKIYIDDYIGYNYRFGGMTTRYNKNLLPNLKVLYSIKKRTIEEYKYDKASEYIRIELKNVFISDINQRILFHYGSKEDIINQINQELTDPIWSDIQQIKNSNIIASSIVQAIINKDANAIYEICKSEIRKYYPQWLFKRIISKIFDFV